jgi:hypothetical protein
MLCKRRATAPRFLIWPHSSPWKSVHLWGPAPSSSHLRSAKRASHTWPWDNVIYGDLINKNRLRVYAHVGFPVLRWWYLVMFAGGLAVSRSRLTPPDVLNQGARFTVDASKKVRNKNLAELHQSRSLAGNQVAVDTVPPSVPPANIAAAQRSPLCQ